ncbi:hypothetical protein BGS_1378 [Beggiatoa sp. SS]|nr:hypothetical protein BGS_1378 [Beggiatoa sp. SS]
MMLPHLRGFFMGALPIGGLRNHSLFRDESLLKYNLKMAITLIFILYEEFCKTHTSNNKSITYTLIYS